MEEFERGSTLGMGNGGVRAEFRRLESGMKDFKPSSDAWNREWKSSSQVRGLESGMEEFEPCSRLGIGNGGVRAKFWAWNREWRSSSQFPTLGIGNGSVRAKFEAWNRE